MGRLLLHLYGVNDAVSLAQSDAICSALQLINFWYRVQISFASGSVHDVTTWDAQIAGDPVRLIE